MDPDIWWTFAIATFIICATPGPNMLHMLTSGTRYGFRRTIPDYGRMLPRRAFNHYHFGNRARARCSKPHQCCSNYLRYLGAAYLIYIGAKSFINRHSFAIDSEITAVEQPATTPKQIFAKGFLVGISNPKSFLFATAFFPQFIDSTKPELHQFAILLLSFAVMEWGLVLNLRLRRIHPRALFAAAKNSSHLQPGDRPVIYNFRFFIIVI